MWRMIDELTDSTDKLKRSQFYYIDSEQYLGITQYITPFNFVYGNWPNRKQNCNPLEICHNIGQNAYK